LPPSYPPDAALVNHLSTRVAGAGLHRLVDNQRQRHRSPPARHGRRTTNYRATCPCGRRLTSLATALHSEGWAFSGALSPAKYAARRTRSAQRATRPRRRSSARRATTCGRSATQCATPPIGSKTRRSADDVDGARPAAS